MTDQDTGLTPKVSIRLAQSAEEVTAAQRLRYKVFYEEFHAIADEETARTHLDADEFDAITDHLIVLDKELPDGDQIVGTYRLLRQPVAEKFGKFYTSGEFNVDPLLAQYKSVLELGRSCVLPAYRTRPVLQKLWQGIAQYVMEHRIDLMFGCGSLYGINPEDIAAELSYLHHYHLADASVRPVAQPHRYVNMNLIPKEEIDAKTTFMKLPPLIKGYLRIGASIGDGAVIDSQWNSIDVCIVMPTSLVTEKYMKHYQRDNNALAELEKDLAQQSAHHDAVLVADQKKAF